MLAALPFPAFFEFLFAVRNLLSEGTEKKLRRFFGKSPTFFWKGVFRAFTHNLREIAREMFGGQGGL